MAMRENGLVKLSEECAEVIQVAQKLIAYPDLQPYPAALFSDGTTALHPDGTDLRKRLEDEIGDAIAAVQFVRQKLCLSDERIWERIGKKLELFRQWDSEQ